MMWLHLMLIGIGACLIGLGCIIGWVARQSTYERARWHEFRDRSW
jgi:hypothetical protein